MRLAAAHGLAEDVVTTVVSSSQGDSRGIRTWGRMDRIRRERLAVGAADSVYAQVTKDLRTAVAVAEAEGLELPLVAAVAAELPPALRRRDAELDARGPVAAVPCCAGCGQELAAPFRAAGLHPECG
jgi:3-hydroxyisobutyrate dehydrogenase-like beta-hydroxyacid dehydrogenase